MAQGFTASFCEKVNKIHEYLEISTVAEEVTKSYKARTTTHTNKLAAALFVPPQRLGEELSRLKRKHVWDLTL